MFHQEECSLVIVAFHAGALQPGYDPVKKYYRNASFEEGIIKIIVCLVVTGAYQEPIHSVFVEKFNIGSFVDEILI